MTDKKEKELTPEEAKRVNTAYLKGVKSQEEPIKAARALSYECGLSKGTATGMKEGVKKGKEEGFKEGKGLGLIQGNREGKDETFPIAYEKGATDTRISFVSAIERNLSKADGYTDLEKWRDEFKIPSWWIACLFQLWEPSYKHQAEDKGVKDGITD